MVSVLLSIFAIPIAILQILQFCRIIHASPVGTKLTNMLMQELMNAVK